MIQPRQRAGLAVETLDERRVAAELRQHDFQRDNAVELLLPRLVNNTHPALPEHLENLELRKKFGDVVKRRGVVERNAHGGRSLGGRGRGRAVGIHAGAERDLHEALGTQALGRVGGQRFLAGRAVSCGGVHRLYGSVHPLQKDWRRKVTEYFHRVAGKTATPRERGARSSRIW